MSITISKTIDFDLSDVDTEDLIEELESRAKSRNTARVLSNSDWDLLTKIYEKRTIGTVFDRELDEFMWNVIGRM